LKVLITDFNYPDVELERDILEDAGLVIILATALGSGELIFWLFTATSPSGCS
jgi:hypothetical protein